LICPTEGRVEQVGIPIKLSKTPGEIRALAALPGGHTDAQLLALGYTREKIAELREAGAI